MASENEPTADQTLKEVGNFLFEMESDVRDVRLWADVLIQIGTAPNQISPGTIRVIGSALHELSGCVLAMWEEAFKLTHPRGGQS